MAETNASPAYKTFFLFSGFLVKIVTRTISNTAISHGLTESAKAKPVMLVNKDVSITFIHIL